MRVRQLMWWSAVVVAVLAAVWYFGIRTKGVDTATEPLWDRPECAHKDSMVVDPNFDQTSGIPEYNDCQRFIVGPQGGREYDSLYAVFVSEVAPTITTALGTPLPGLVRPRTSVTTSGAPVIQPPVGTMLAPTSATAITIAIIKSEGGTYAPLGIVPGMNCLYIWYYSSGGNVIWQARMTPAFDNLCIQRTVGQIESLVGKDLQVNRREVEDPVTNQKFVRADYPNVARWDWDLKNGQQFVGIVCDVAWCEIADPDKFESPPPLPLDGTKTAAERRVRLIKGWNDQQFLAKRLPNGSLAPSELVGTIFPEPDLGILDNPSDFNGWRTTAWIVVDPTTPDGDETLAQYKTKMGYRKSTFKNPLRVQLKNEVVILWRGRVQHKILGPIWGSQENHVHFRATGAGGYSVPGTSRWRWRDIDEGTWTRCTQGCCEMEG